VKWVLAAAIASSGCVDLTHVDHADPRAVESALASGPRGPLDVAIALGCPADDDTGRSSTCERCRVKSALRAYRDGEVGAIIMSGGPAHNQFVEADAMGDLALARGLPPEALERDRRALTTWMNLRYSQRIMRDRGWRTALIVSTSDHLPRARRFAEWFGIAARYRACDRDLPHDSDAEWNGPIQRHAFRSQ
jgi:vancomycin permeability regulator SanA